MVHGQKPAPLLRNGLLKLSPQSDDALSAVLASGSANYIIAATRATIQIAVGAVAPIPVIGQKWLIVGDLDGAFDQDVCTFRSRSRSFDQEHFVQLLKVKVENSPSQENTDASAALREG